MDSVKTDILASVKILAEVKDDSDDELILLLIDDAIEAVLSYCHIEILPRQLESFIPIIVARQYENKEYQGVHSLTQGERRVEYKNGEYDFLGEYSMRLKPFISRCVRVPSDLECDENESV